MEYEKTEFPIFEILKFISEDNHVFIGVYQNNVEYYMDITKDNVKITTSQNFSINMDKRKVEFIHLLGNGKKVKFVYFSDFSGIFKNMIFDMDVKHYVYILYRILKTVEYELYYETEITKIWNVKIWIFQNR